jgi:hypothetical protein
MADPTTLSSPLPTLSSAALRLVLFGMPDAGKSSLLGALAQAAQTQEHLLNGHLTDLSQGLAELQQRLYEERPRETLDEVVPYPVTFETFVPAGRTGGNKVQEAVLIDCDGRVANELLSRKRDLDGGKREGSLAQAILDADALLLVVDASAAPVQVEADFTEFGRFLRLLEQLRGRQIAIGGLPVFLVLTKCDLLAKAEDSAAEWIDHIEERKRQLASRFQDVLTRQKTTGPLTFGRIDLHIWATAVKRPNLVEAPAKPREPYGVAELFRQALEQAGHYHARRKHSGRRLFWTVSAGLGLTAGLVLLGVTLFLNQHQEPPATRELMNKVEGYRGREAATASGRLREPLQRKISELSDLESDPHFGELPPESQDFVRAHLKELQDYLAFKNELAGIPALESVHTERELDDLRRALANLAVPQRYREEWTRTEAVLELQHRLDEIKAFQSAVNGIEDWYSGLVRRGRESWVFSDQKEGAPVPWRDWQNQVQTLLAEAEGKRHRPTEKIPATTVTYEMAYQFDKAAEARRGWDAVKAQLQRVVNLSTALGLTGALPGLTPLDIPAGFSADQPPGRLQELEKAYPGYDKAFTLTDLPDAIAGEIRRAALTRYENLLPAGRALVLRHLESVATEDRESPEAWKRLRTWLAAPEDLSAWRALALPLVHLQNPDGADPVAALAAFLHQDQFELVMQRLALEVPDSLKVHPAGKLLVHHQAGDSARVLVFEPTADESHDLRRRRTTYRYRQTSGSTMTYRPGDSYWIELPCKNGDDPDWLFTWNRSRSQVYQFERVLYPPRLHRKGQEATDGEVANGVTLSVLPENGLPRVPDLLPIVPFKLEKR